MHVMAPRGFVPLRLELVWYIMLSVHQCPCHFAFVWCQWISQAITVIRAHGWWCDTACIARIVFVFHGDAEYTWHTALCSALITGMRP